MKWLCLLLIPVVYVSCAHDICSMIETVSVRTDVELSVLSREGAPVTRALGMNCVKWIDVFLFDDDDIASLDTYQRFFHPSWGDISVCSRSGQKRLVVLANCLFETSLLAAIDCYDTLESLCVDFADDDPAYPFMSGETAFLAGETRSCDVSLRPVMSEIVVESIRETIGLQNLRVSFVGGGARAELLRNDGFRPPEVFDSAVVPYSPWMKFYTYPNNSVEEGIGSPFGKLLVQGDYRGATYYYSIPVNRDGFGWVVGPEGICRNVSYRMNIELTKLGSSSPNVIPDPSSVVQQGWMALHPGNYVSGLHGESLHVWVEVMPEETPVSISVEDLEDDRRDGLYEYEIDPDGKGVMLHLLKGGMGLFTIDAGPPVNDGYLIVVMIDP